MVAIADKRPPYPGSRQNADEEKQEDQHGSQCLIGQASVALTAAAGK